MPNFALKRIYEKKQNLTCINDRFLGSLFPFFQGVKIFQS